MKINYSLYAPVFLLVVFTSIYVIFALSVKMSLELISMGIAAIAVLFSISTYLINYKINCLNHFDNWLLNLNNKLIEHPELIQDDADTDEQKNQGLRNIHGGNAWNFMESVYLRGYQHSPHLKGAFKTYVKRYNYLFREDAFDKDFVAFIKKNYSEELKINDET